MKEITQKPGLHTLIFLGAIVCFAFFQFCYPYHLFYQEQNQLFLNTWEYMLSYFGKPGWLACLTGDFLTQFYYYRFLGPAILTLCILASGYNVRRCVQTAGVKGSWGPYTAAFVAMTLLVCFCFDADYRLSSIIAFMGGANVFLASAKSLRFSQTVIDDLDSLGKKKVAPPQKKMTLSAWVSIFNIFITIPVCHWFFGYGMWVYTLFVILGCLVHIKMVGNLYRLTALALGLLLLMWGKQLYFTDYPTLYSYPGIGSFSLPQMDQEKAIASDCEYYLGDYNRIIAQVEKEKEPNKYTKFYYHLVTAQNRSLTESYNKFSDGLGTQERLDHNVSSLTIHTLNELYWVLGDMTLCKRAALLGNITSPDSRNIRMVKRLAEINLVTGDYMTARKYLRILQKTMVWHKWANRIFAALGRHATQEEALTLKPYLDKRPFVNTRDTLRLDDNCLTCMRELAESNPDNNIAINYLLCSDIQAGDLHAFKHDYDAYYLKQKSVAYDRLYQEALAKYLSQTNASPEEWRYYIKRSDIMKQYHHNY